MPVSLQPGSIPVADSNSLFVTVYVLMGCGLLYQPAGPVYVALFATILKLETMTKMKAMGVLSAVAGALGKCVIRG